MVNKSTILDKKKIFYSIFFIIFFSVIFYISWLIWILNTIFSIIIYSFIFYIFYIIWNKLRKKEILSFDKYLNIFLFKVSIAIIISVSIIWGLSYYSNEISPAPMPTYTLSNWEKTIIFQAMSHIWTKDFYQKVRKDLIKAKNDWYVYFYEWVKDWTSKNKEEFNKAMWIKFDKNLYKNFSKLYWVINQDNSIYYNLVNNLDYNVDLSIDEIMKFYKKSPIQNNKNNLLQNKEVIDVNAEIIKTLSSLNNKELKILRYINKAMLNFLISSEKTQAVITNNLWNKKLFSVILDKRNDILAEEIIKSEHKKIYITYWLLHFKWVFELLQKNDKKWKIIKTDYLYPIK